MGYKIVSAQEIVELYIFANKFASLDKKNVC